MYFDFHHGPKNSCFDIKTLLTEKFNESLIKRLRDFRWSRVREAWTAPFSDVAVQRELGYCKYLTPRIEDGAIHFSVLVRKDTKINTLLRPKFQFRVAIARVEANQKDQTGSDTADDALLDRNRSLGDSLKNNAHGRS